MAVTTVSNGNAPRRGPGLPGSLALALALLAHCGGQSDGGHAGTEGQDSQHSAGRPSDDQQSNDQQSAGASGSEQSSQDVPAESSLDCNPYACDCGWGTAGFGPPAHCVGSQFCNADADCPEPWGSSIEPICQSLGDVVIDGSTGQCVLPCDGDAACPSDMRCLGGRCRFATYEADALCSEDVECDAVSGYHCALATCEGERRCRREDVSCPDSD